MQPSSTFHVFGEPASGCLKGGRKGEEPVPRCIEVILQTRGRIAFNPILYGIVFPVIAFQL